MGILDKNRPGMSRDAVLGLAERSAGSDASPSSAIGPQRAAPRSVAAIQAESRLIASWLASGVPVVDGRVLEGESFAGVDLANGESQSGDLAIEPAEPVAQVEPEKIPLPDSIIGPCDACDVAGRGRNPLFWQDRYGVVRCCGCQPCPSRVLFGRMLVMRRGLAVNEITGRPGGKLEFWFVEADARVRNPWANGAGVVAEREIGNRKN